MGKLIPFLCLALAVGLSDCSWSLVYGERTTNPGHVFADSDGAQGVANPAVPVEQYYDNNADLSQSPLTTGNVEVYNPTVPLPEHKSGTKGGFFGFFKPKQQQPQLVVPFPGGQEQPFANSGYIDNVPNLSTAPLLNSTPTTNKEQKNRLRGYLPWNWVFVTPSTQQAAQESLESAQPAVPKRSWSILPPYRPAYQPTRQQCQCWGQPAYTYPIYSVPIQTVPQYEIPNAKAPNVQLVNPSDDIRGLESNPTPNYVVPPTSGTGNTFQSPLPTAPKTPILQVPSVSTAEATDVTGQTNVQQGTAQQGAFNFPTNNFSNNPNSPSVPVPTNNFQSSAGEVAQNNQQNTAN